MTLPLHIVILAAGKGVRMHSTLPKVLHKIGGQPLLAHVIEVALSLNPAAIHVVYGEGGELVKNQLNNHAINWVEQKERLGTGHAVQQVLPNLPDEAQILVLYGDVPLITTQLLQNLLLTSTYNTHNPLALVTATFTDPTGYGRIVRNSNAHITAIVEDKDANEQQRQITEVNSGILTATSKILKQYLPKLQSHNNQNEYYLTDVIALAIADGIQIQSTTANNSIEVLGINNKGQLAQLERYYQRRQVAKLLQQGVTILDPARLDIRGTLTIAEDVTLDVNVVLAGQITIGSKTTIGANCYLKDVVVGNNVEILPNCVIEGAIIESNCTVGPFARIRPQSHIASGARIGNFVEIKNTYLGSNSKANHLTYLGDSSVGTKVNIGAGTITCNYDGANKYKTTIENGAFIGSGCELVAPIKIGENATVGAGSTLSCDAPANKLTVARAKQVTVEDWQRPVKGQLKECKECENS